MVKEIGSERRQRKPVRREKTARNCAALVFFLTPVLFPFGYMTVNREQILAARRTDLYYFLLRMHPDRFVRTPRNLFLKENQSLVIRTGFSSYKDYATMETGNSIDFLIRYLGYSFPEAVSALSGSAFVEEKGTQKYTNAGLSASQKKIELPDIAPFPHSRMYAFLSARKIPKDLIDTLSAKGLIYQESKMNNVVFVNKERDYCELRGTYTFAEKAFHGCRKSKSDRFWYFTEGTGKPQNAYITEAAIDAMSLYLLQKKNGLDTLHTVYISIGGVANDATINRISRGIHTVLAVDNDPAGELCRKRHSDLEAIIPTCKDWNEDLQNL